MPKPGLGGSIDFQDAEHAPPEGVDEKFTNATATPFELLTLVIIVIDIFIIEIKKICKLNGVQIQILFKIKIESLFFNCNTIKEVLKLKLKLFIYS